ncbi:NAD(P)H-dependent glycerol-3-phosphate dehydrogenase [Bacteroidota bacterium]
MFNNLNIAVIGAGSWGTAIVKLLVNNCDNINWWVRQQETIDHIKTYHRNPNYLRYAELNPEKLTLSNNLKEIVKTSDMLIFAIPAPFVAETLSNSGLTDLSDKIVVSAIKGIIPEENILVSDFLNRKFNVDYNNIGVIAGPCHSEEVAMQKQSFLTVAFKDIEKAEFLKKQLSTWYLKISTKNDIIGIEYSAVLKNIIAIANGICISLGYGDNFQAVLIVNAVQEVHRFLNKVYPAIRDINDSVYIGDIIVTAYSKFSRNRMFGNYIGKGYSVKATRAEMKMIAEGYFAVKCMYEMNKEFNVDMPIAETVYNIIYEQMSPDKQMILLAEKLS